MSNIDSIAVQPVPSTEPAVHWQINHGTDGLVVVRGAQTPDPEPADWRDRLAWFIANTPGVAMVGAKRFLPTGHVFSLGEFVIHPKGFHHVGKGVDGKAYRFPEECDTIAGGVVVINESTFDEVEGERILEELGSLGMLGLGLAIRRAGGRVLAAPQAGVVDTFSPALNDAETAAFLDEFGFDWVAPDLDYVREAHAGQGLLWNAYFHAGMMPFEKYDQRGALCWEGYKGHEAFRQRAHHLAQLVAKFTNAPDGVGGHTLDVGSGDGLFTHLFALEGCKVFGIDPEPEGVAQATQMCAQQTYPEGKVAPEFKVGRGDAIPFESETAACVSLFDVIEHLNNPIGVLNEISRVLKPGGHFICVTPAWQFGASSDAVYHGYEYTVEELNRQINAANGMQVIHNGQIGGVYRDLVAIARKAV
jgi:SAM-dependent methyltransferase